MKTLPLAAFGTTALLLAGCAGAVPATGHESRWYNPASWHWPAVNPLHGSGASLRVTEQGVGGLTGATPMCETALHKGLGSNYRLRKGMRSEEGRIVTFWQGISENGVALEISGDSSVSKVVVMDARIAGPHGEQVGMPFSKIYSKAFGNCQKAGEVVCCQAPQSQHIWYQFSGAWHGPEALLPDDATLKTWRLNKIIWQS